MRGGVGGAQFAQALVNALAPPPTAHGWCVSLLSWLLGGLTEAGCTEAGAAVTAVSCELAVLLQQLGVRCSCSPRSALLFNTPAATDTASLDKFKAFFLGKKLTKDTNVIMMYRTGWWHVLP